MNEQTIYNRLRQAGLTEAGALGVLGNWACESGCEPNRVQGDFSPYRSISKAYVAKLNSGELSMNTFARDAKGFGLAQWTYWSRKEEMYHEWKSSGLPIDSVEFQVGFALKELARDFPTDFNLLKTTSDVYAATKAVCARFENPAVHNIDARFSAAQRIKGEINLNNWQTDTELEHPKEKPKTEYWPPRMICQGMTGPDVEVLQAVLKARGIVVTNPDGIFGSYLEGKVKEFQMQVFPNQPSEHDGIVGQKTWSKLLERGG
jgi:hypothetical protein